MTQHLQRSPAAIATTTRTRGAPGCAEESLTQAQQRKELDFQTGVEMRAMTTVMHPIHTRVPRIDFRLYEAGRQVCSCGCGEPIPANPRRRYATPTFFIPGHAQRRTGPDWIVDPDTGCWNWIGGRITMYGYGVKRLTTGVGGPTAMAHRWVYERFVGPIPGGLQLDHLCENKRCVNPDHLEPVTAWANTMRSPQSPAAQNAAKTHCKYGHPFDNENTSWAKDGERRCRTCARLRARRIRAERKAA